MVKVGITSDWEEPAGKKRQVLNAEYAEWLYGAGMYPVVLPPIPGSEDAALDGLSALVLSGGGDIRPELYGADPEPLPEEKYSHRERSAFEFALVWRSLRISVPVLGICLGCQTLNAALGGDLVRHLSDPRAHHRRPGAGGRISTRHRLHVLPGSLVASLYPSADTRVVSSHHQALGRLAPGWAITAWGPEGVAEAIENPLSPCALGVQWHPERTPKSRLSVNLAAWLRGRAEGYARGRGTGDRGQGTGTRLGDLVNRRLGD
jgi:putative glutamine amidotransferase